MAVTKLSNSGIKTGILKYDSMLAGNAAFDPAATWLIQRVNGTGSATTITFSSIPQTYQHLQLRFQGRVTFNGGGSVYNAVIRFNSDTGTNYTWHAIRGTGSSALAYGSTSQTKFTIDSVFPDAGTTSNTSGAAIVDIHDYANSSKNKTARAFSGNDTNGAGNVWLTSSLWLNTNAITSITIENNGGYAFTSGSTFALYGYKG